ncbi:hypothetical protein SAMN04487910_1950 [Aquimarina amphilecti]|uniref:Uncharacterized protein n=1 Tax=Aquimarina amphilecti TaxID=1038014 RepID=A0A1H7N3G6_AQUAM|nr:hypothetical protein [Aquimarina amphilecti]SEL18030.1 hypothetical protein SAMN04487910_1950 [Aquimarina amphilecti]
MKKFLLSIVFISFSIAISAQESNSNKKIEENTITKELPSINSDVSIQTNNTTKETKNLDKVCYGETSKVAFYEVLISKNGFDINLKNSTDLVIKNTEEIISRKIEEVLYSEEEE